MADLSILMPVYNERATIQTAIDRVLAAELPVQRRELVIVDDGSTDGTRELLSAGDWPDGVRVLTHERNRGKGAALRTGLATARGRYTAIMDADLEYDPQDIAKLLEPLVSGEAQVVFGVRGFAGSSSYSFWYVVGNKVVTFTASLLFDRWLGDVMTCHKVMPTEVLRSLRLSAAGFAIEPQVTGRLLRAGYQIFEVPISYRARTRAQGKKLTAADGVRTLAMLVRCRLERPSVGDMAGG